MVFIPGFQGDADALHLQLLSVHGDPGKSHRLAETPRSAAARVQEQGMTCLLFGIAVGVARDDQIIPGYVRRQIVFPMRHADAQPVPAECLLQGQIQIQPVIVIAQHRLYGADAFQGPQDVRIPDIPGMQDQIAALQSLQHFFPQQAMGIRHHTDAGCLFFSHMDHYNGPHLPCKLGTGW